jgi:hypothetical protein
MEITIQLKREAADSASARSGPSELHRAARELGIDVQPLHPGETDPQLSRYFTAEVDDPGAAEAAAERLRSCPGVEAAYVKARGAPP